MYDFIKPISGGLILLLKPRYLPLIVHFNQALIQRLDPDHPKIPQINNTTRSFMSGYHGEKATDYHLEFLNDKNHLIFGGLRLPDGEHYFQIDTPVLSRKFILLLETKNMKDELTFTKEQFKQASNYGEKGYKHPIIQVNHHKEQLQAWLNKHKLPQLPIIPLVVLSHPSAIIKITEPELLKQVCKVDNLKNKILEITAPYTKDIVTTRELKKMANLLLKDDTPSFPNFQTKYRIPIEDVSPGVCCPKCFTFQMLRKDRIWVCPHCLCHSKDTYLDALLDYFLLYKLTINNKEFREFLGFDTMKTASYLLSTLNLPTTGSKKGRIYHRPSDFLDQLESRYNRSKDE